MATSTAHKPSAKSNLDIAKAIATLQEQVKANSEAIKQVLPKDKVQVSDRTLFIFLFTIMMTFSFFYFNKLDHKIDSRIDKLDHKIDSRIDKLDHKIDSRIDKLDHKIDSNHKQILDILLKQSK